MRIFALAAVVLGAGVPLFGYAASRHQPGNAGYNHGRVPTTMTLNAVMAPADEYFGHQRESILEIRNRLRDLARLTDDQIYGRMSELEDLRDAVLDWQHKYPHDPWLPRMLERLKRDFQRASGY